MSRALVADIITLAAEMAAIDRKVLTGRSRYRRVVRVRQACMLLARENNHSYPTIGRMFGRDHSTVIHGCEVAADTIARDPDYAAFVARLRTGAAKARPYIAERLSVPVFVKPKVGEAKPATPAKPKAKTMDSDVRKQNEDADAMRKGSRDLARAIRSSLRAREQMRMAG